MTDLFYTLVSEQKWDGKVMACFNINDTVRSLGFMVGALKTEKEQYPCKQIITLKDKESGIVSSSIGINQNYNETNKDLVSSKPLSSSQGAVNLYLVAAAKIILMMVYAVVTMMS